jgi:hypothetical protein
MGPFDFSWSSLGISQNPERFFFDDTATATKRKEKTHDELIAALR